jgi:hypothetical protein
LDPATISPETQKVIGTCAVALGVVYCAFGYRFFKVALFATGFMGFSIGATYLSYLLSPEGNALAAVLGILGGLAGGFLFFFVYLIGVFALGASFGGLIGVALTSVAGRDLQPLLIAVLGVVGGTLALLIQRHVVILATSFCGGGSAVSGAWYVWKGTDPTTVVTDPASLGREFHAIIVCWLMISILGIVVQYGVTGKPRKDDEEEEGGAEEPVEDESELPTEAEEAGPAEPRALADDSPEEDVEEERPL